MSQVVWDEMTESPGALPPSIFTAANDDPPPLLDQPSRPKSRRRIFQSLQRMSSSPSLAKIGRTPSSTYMAGGKASLSCVSLSASSLRHGHSDGHSYSSTQTSAGYSTAPTSVPQTPGADAPDFALASRIRHLNGEVSGHVVPIPKSVPLPPEVRSGLGEGGLSPMGGAAVFDDYFSKPIVRTKELKKKRAFSLWSEIPHEIAISILTYLKPKEIVRCSVVSKAWYSMCFDGQLWTNVDTEEYYQKISAASLTRIMTKAGPFVRDLNLRGCAQMPERWGSEGQSISDVCRNLENFSLEGCRIDRSSVHYFLLRNPRLVHINVSGLKDLSNSAMRIIAQGCQQLEHLNVSWCHGIDTRGLLRIVQSCPKLRDLRAGEVKGFNEKAILLELFERNNLERLMLSNCADLDDEALQLLIQGEEPAADPLTNRVMVPPRKLRHLDLSRCRALTSKGIRSLAHNVPRLEGLQLSHCEGVMDNALTGILDSVSLLTHLDLEELDELTNATLQSLARSPCISRLKHLNISYCEKLGDTGMLQVMKACPKLQSAVMDNTRVSDLVLTEAAAQVRARDRSKPRTGSALPEITLHLVVYDCQNVTWTGVREILARNTEANRREVISLKCFYGYQDTVNEHVKRVLRGDAAAAGRLERKWGEYMVASEEAGAQGAGARRRRRRLREAAMVHAVEEDGGPRGGRRRARSGGCAVM